MASATVGFVALLYIFLPRGLDSAHISPSVISPPSVSIQTIAFNSGLFVMVLEGATPEAARKQFYVCSSVGLLGAPNGPYGDKNLKRAMQEERIPWLRTDLPIQ